MRLSSAVLRVGAVVAVLAVVYVAGFATAEQRVQPPSGGGTGGSGGAADQGGVVAGAERTILQNAAGPVTSQTLNRAAVQGMLSSLGDKWSNYLSPQQYQAFEAVLAGRYAGVGVWVRRDADGVSRVASVQPGSPAAAAGVMVGDELVKVDGVSVAGRPVAEIVTALRGPSGTAVTLQVRRGGQVRTLNLRRATLESDDVAASVVDDVMVIKVMAFTRGVGADVARYDAQARSAHLSGIVLDLRGNPGGLVEEAVDTASVFLDGGRVVTYLPAGKPPVVLDATPGGDTSTRLAVLVDGGTASAAEIVAAALQDRNRALIVGSRTFGKGTVQRPTELADGSAIEFTVGRYVTPSGRDLDGVGVEPDLAVGPDATPTQARKAAVDVIGGLLADAGTGGHG